MQRLSLGTTHCYSQPKRFEQNIPIQSFIVMSIVLVNQVVSLYFNLENPSVLTADLFSKFQVILPHSSQTDFQMPARDIHEVI